MLTSGTYLDPFILTEQQLLDIYNSAICHIKEGKMLMSWTGEGTTASHQFSASPMEIAREARLALKQKNPKRYGFIATSARVFFA